MTGPMFLGAIGVCLLLLLVALCVLDQRDNDCGIPREEDEP